VISDRLTALADAIRSASGLWELRAALIAFEAAVPQDADTEIELAVYGVDLCDLPTFGGEPLADTMSVWSWDADRLLVGEGPFADWNIVDRK